MRTRTFLCLWLIGQALTSCVSAPPPQASGELEFAATEVLIFPRQPAAAGMLPNGHIVDNEAQIPTPAQQQLSQIFSASSRRVLDWDFLCARPRAGALDLTTCVVGQAQLYTPEELGVITTYMRTRSITIPADRRNDSIERFVGSYRINRLSDSRNLGVNDCRTPMMCGVSSVPRPPVPPRPTGQ